MELEPEYLDANRDVVPAQVMKERLKLAQAGAIFLSVSVSKMHKHRTSPVRLDASGVVDEKNRDMLLFEAAQKCEAKLDALLKQGKLSIPEIEEQLRTELRRHFKRRLPRKPVVLVSITEA
jgi:mRNA degradation ribonuclease J1/J2